MEFNIETWLQDFTKKLFDHFSRRIKFVGLQGSYKRGEAKENSDIDIVIILDRLTFEDLTEYKKIVRSMPFHEKVCGFVSGEREIYNWPKFDLFQLANDTISLHGNLYDFIPILKRNDILDSVKINTANLYHQMCHGYLFEKSNVNVLYQGYKSAFFILQAVYYVRNTEYIGTKKDLLTKLDGEDKEILLVNMNWQSLNIAENSDFYFEKIINWAGRYI
ncbi:nucleotidyltransferase domain protein [Fusobacterium sp. CAG:439]|nr:nucleotidyltransferase domain protein [Fusobacterium sp. CAG:439]HIT92337.1 nucleotidyltransferase domain-containing protein [Candidatus Stercorousia faecigallinarum]